MATCDFSLFIIVCFFSQWCRSARSRKVFAFEKDFLRSYGDASGSFDSVDEEPEPQPQRDLSLPPATPTALRAPNEKQAADASKGARRDVPRVPLCWEDQQRDRRNRFVPLETELSSSTSTQAAHVNAAGRSMARRKAPPPEHMLEGRSLRSAICGPGASALVPHGLPLESGVDEEGDDEAHKILQLAAAAITEASRKSAQSTPLHIRFGLEQQVYLLRSRSEASTCTYVPNIVLADWDACGRESTRVRRRAFCRGRRSARATRRSRISCRRRARASRARS